MQGWWLKLCWSDPATGPQAAPCKTMAGIWELLHLNPGIIDPKWSGGTIRLVHDYPSEAVGLVLAQVDQRGSLFNTMNWDHLGPSQPEWRLTADDWAARLGVNAPNVLNQLAATWLKPESVDLKGLSAHAEELRQAGRGDLAATLSDVLVWISSSEETPTMTPDDPVATPQDPVLQVSATVIGGHSILLRDERGREICSVPSGRDLALLLDYHSVAPERDTPGWLPWTLTNAGSFDLPDITAEDNLDSLTRQGTWLLTFADLVRGSRTAGQHWPEALTTCLVAERRATTAIMTHAGRTPPDHSFSDFGEFSLLIATSPPYWAPEDGPEPSEGVANGYAEQLAAAARAEFPGLRCDLVNGPVEKRDQSSGPDVAVREKLETWLNSRMGEMLGYQRRPMPQAVRFWRVDEVIECLPFGDELARVESALLAALPHAYQEHRTPEDREFPAEPDADAEFKLAVVWDALPADIQSAICRASEVSFPTENHGVPGPAKLGRRR